jgi:hypothetical protein
MFALPKMEKFFQIIEDRYIDEDKLLELCSHKFGPGNYKLRVGILSLVTRFGLLTASSSNSINGISKYLHLSMKYVPFGSCPGPSLSDYGVKQV